MKLLLQNGREYHNVGSNEEIELYLWVDLWYAKLMPKNYMYYKLQGNPSRKLQKLTKNNLRNDFIGTPFENKISVFLAQHHPSGRDRKTRGYKILKVLNVDDLSQRME